MTDLSTKSEWMKPELEKLSVEKTLSGAFNAPIEVFDGGGNPFGGPQS